MVGIGHGTYSGQAICEDQPGLSGWKLYSGIFSLARHKLRKSTGTPGKDSTLPWTQFDTGDDRPQGNLTQRERVPDLGRCLWPGIYRLSNLQAVLGYNVPLLPICIGHQGNKGRTVRVVLNRQHFSSDILLVALEIDNSIPALMAASPVTHGHLAAAIPTSRPFKGNQKALLRTTGGNRVETIYDFKSLSGCDRF
jgi:hypothetical protein